MEGIKRSEIGVGRLRLGGGRLIREVVQGDDAVHGEFAGGEDVEGLKLADLGSETFAADAADLVVAAVGAAADDEFFVDDNLPGVGEKGVGIAGVQLFHELGGGGGVTFEVVTPALDGGGHEGAEGGGVGAGPRLVGDERGVGVKTGVPSVEKFRGLGATGEDMKGFGDVEALLDEALVGDEVGDGEVLGDDIKIDAVFVTQVREEGPLGAGHDSFAVEGLEGVHGVVGVEHEDGRVVLEDGADVDNRQALGDGAEGISAIGLAHVSLGGGELLHNEGVGAAGDEFDVEAGGGEAAGGLSLEEAAVFGFGNPIELHDDFGERAGTGGSVGRGGGRRGAGAASGEGDEQQGGEEGARGENHGEGLSGT